MNVYFPAARGRSEMATVADLKTGENELCKIRFQVAVTCLHWFEPLTSSTTVLQLYTSLILNCKCLYWLELWEIVTFFIYFLKPLSP